MSRPIFTQAIIDAHQIKNGFKRVGRISNEGNPAGFVEVEIKTRVRQGEKPLNKLEAEFGRTLEPLAVHIRAQSKRYRLANGAWYKPDWTGEVLNHATDEFEETCWEVKGGKGMKGHAKSMLTLKVAAAIWPEVVWILAWKENGVWQTQRINP